jgi:hypothetical protein|tara:strand:+ start:314 stop:916 length:603 start_codon:yes stop_codon:yes gene_type:complete
MANIKHVGQLVNTQKRVIVVFRELPDDQNHALVVDTDALPDWMHDDMISAVESPSAQASANFYEYAERSVFTDGTNMLQTLHNTGKLIKTPTKNVKMTPNNSVAIALDEINDIIRNEGKAAPVVAPDPMQLQPASLQDNASAAKPGTPEPLDDTALAASMVAQAAGFEAEAETLRTQAYEMDPSLKPRRGRPAAKKSESA